MLTGSVLLESFYRNKETKSAKHSKGKAGAEVWLTGGTAYKELPTACPTPKGLCRKLRQNR